MSHIAESTQTSPSDLKPYDTFLHLLYFLEVKNSSRVSQCHRLYETDMLAARCALDSKPCRLKLKFKGPYPKCYVLRAHGETYSTMNDAYDSRPSLHRSLPNDHSQVTRCRYLLCLYERVDFERSLPARSSDDR